MDAQLIALWGTEPMREMIQKMGLSYSRISNRARTLGLQLADQRSIYEIPKQEWKRIATERAISAGVAPRDVIEGYVGCKRVIRARWKAFRDTLVVYPRCSIAALARVSGFDRTAIMHGLVRLNGASPYGSRATGRRPYLHGVVAIPASTREAAIA